MSDEASTPIYVVAEAGSCGDGSLGKMQALISVAADVGADAVKFQWTSSARKMTRRRHAKGTGYGKHYKDMLQWPAQWHEQLALTAQQRGVDYMCTVYLPEDVEVITPYVSTYKISSFEYGDTDLVDAMDPQKQVFLSTGMVDRDNLGFAFRYSADRVKLLHCVSAYPAPLDSVNLSVLGSRWTLDDVYEGAHMSTGLVAHRDEVVFDGFSDHTSPNYVSSGALAVAAGANILEAHLKLATTDPNNPDFPHAMTDAQFASYTANVRDASRIMGSPTKARQPAEDVMSSFRVVPWER